MGSDVTHARRVLVLTDDLMFATRVRETGRRVGVEVDQRPAQPGVIAQLSSNTPDLIVVGLGSGGRPLEVVCDLKADPRTKAIPVLAVYPHVDVELRRAALEAGCDRALPRSAFTTLLPGILAGTA